MSRRRSIILATLVAILLVGVEVTVRFWEYPRACVQIVNQGDGTMEDLTASYGETKFTIGRLPVGQSAKVWFTAGPQGPLKLEYRQRGNSLGGFQVPDFDPIRNMKDNFMLVLVVKSNEVQRFMDDTETDEEKENLGDRIRRWMGVDSGQMKR